MSFETLQQPISATAPYTPFDYLVDFPHIPISSNIDDRIHTVFKDSLFVYHLNNFILDLYLHHTFDTMQFVFAEQIHLLHKTHADISACLQKEKSLREQIETILTEIGAVAKDMAHYSPVQHQHSITRETSARLANSISSVINHNSLLAQRLMYIDFSPQKIETKLIRTILQKTNYYWEYKKVQVSRFDVKE